MPSISTLQSDKLFDPSKSFTVLNFSDMRQEERTEDQEDNHPIKPLKNVNVVKPVLRTYPPKLDDIDYTFQVVATNEPRTERESRRRKRKPDVAVHSQTILDPHFSRNLDLKLRRLKEKEIIAERIARRSKERQKVEQPIIKSKAISVSQPNLTVVRPTLYQLDLPKAEEKDEKLSDRSRRKRMINSNLTIITDRPLFITTVRKGEFLPPPAATAALLGLSSCERTPGVPTLIYSYASRPKIVGATTKSQGVPKSPDKSPIAALTSLAVAAAGLPGRATSYGNLMTDRRIIRGSTSNVNGIAEDDEAIARGARAAAARRRAIARRRGPGAPGLIAGMTRRNEPVQTDLYLEELHDKGSEMEIGIQTDLMLDRLDTPLYVPLRSGCDVETQIIPGELFDFEIEVEPVLEILVDKTIEQAIAECLEEEELAHLRRQAAAATEVRAQAAASARHRQRHLMRILSEKEKRVDDEEADELHSEQRMAALALVKTHLPPLLPAVIGSLRDQGFIADTNTDVDETFLPWLMGEVTQEVESMITNREVLMDIVREVIETRAELYRAMGDDEIVDITSSTISTRDSEVSQKNEDPEHLITEG